MEKPSTPPSPETFEALEVEAAPLPPIDEITDDPADRRRNSFLAKRPPEPRIESVADFAMAAIDANVDPAKMREPPRPSYEGTALLMSTATFGDPILRPMPDAVTEPYVSRKVLRTGLPLTAQRAESGGVRTHALPLVDEALSHRFTVRLTHGQWEALQQRCHSLRMEGDKVTPGALIRRIVDDWINSPPPKP